MSCLDGCWLGGVLEKKRCGYWVFNYVLCRWVLLMLGMMVCLLSLMILCVVSVLVLVLKVMIILFCMVRVLIMVFVGLRVWM